MFQAADLRLLKLVVYYACKSRKRKVKKYGSQQKFQFYYIFSFFSVRPLQVEILNSNNPFSADKKYDIPCQTFGARPPAQISWWLNEKPLLPPVYNHTQTVSCEKLAQAKATSRINLIPNRNFHFAPQKPALPPILLLISITLFNRTHTPYTRYLILV